MQGHRSSLTTLPENFTFDHGSMSSDTGIDSQISWNSMQTSAPNQLPEYRLLSSGTNQYPCHLIRHNGQHNAQWSMGETSSSAAQNNPYGNEGKVEHHLLNYQPQTALTLEEPSNIISLENNVVNLSGNQATANGSFLLQNSSSDAISQDLNMISGFEEDEDDDCQIVEHPNTTYTSIGSSSEDRPRISCKRKALDVQVGPSSGAGASNSFQITERSRWNALPADQIAPININLPTQTQNEFVFNNESEQAYPRLRLGVGGAVPASPFSLTSSGNAEISRRNLRIRNYSLPHQDLVAVNPFLWEANVGNRDSSSSRHSTRFSLRNHLLDLNPVPPMENGIPPVRRNPQARWSIASSSIISMSSAAPNPVPHQEPAEANIPFPRSISEHPIFVPAATEMGSSSEHPTSWNLAGANNSTAGNVFSASESGSSSGVNLSAASWPNRSRPQFPRRLSEMVRRSMLSSAGTDSVGHSANNAVRASPSLTPQEMALLSGTHLHDRHVPRTRSAMLERNLNGAYGGPYSMRTLAAGSERRSSIMSEIRHVLSLMRRGEGLRIEDVMLLDHSVFYGMADIHDRHREMRLDVDNMSYEELLALEERIGNVCTGLSEEAIMNGLKQHKYINNGSRDQVETEPCSVCREEYTDGEDLGRLECGHDYHRDCIKQWLVQKNSCPICKKKGLST